MSAPAQMSLADGNRWTTPNAPLADPLIVKVKLRDAKDAVPGVPVNFTSPGAGGIFAVNPLLTANDGTAQYTTGPNSGKVSSTASTAGVKPVNFTETVQ